MAASRGRNARRGGEARGVFLCSSRGRNQRLEKTRDQEIVVYRNRPGAFFGEVPLLLGTPYMLSARAECDCRLIVFPEEAFWKLLRLCPAISGEIFRAMVTRLRNIEGSGNSRKSWRRSERCPPALRMN